MTWVVDASVPLNALLLEESAPDARAVLAAMAEHPTRFAVPELYAFETFSVLSRLHPAPLEAWTSVILPPLQGGVLRYPMTGAIAADAQRYTAAGLTGYDATYAALAGSLSGTWLTFDRAAHRRIEGLGVSWLLGDGVPDGLR